MADPQLDSGRVDRSAFTVTTFAAAEREDREYWRSRSPEEADHYHNIAGVASIKTPAQVGALKRRSSTGDVAKVTDVFAEISHADSFVSFE